MLAIAAVAILMSPGSARAFCIENRADEAVTFVIDIDGRGNNAPFTTTLAPQEETCCDWQRYDCNMSGKENGVLKFSVGGDEWYCLGEFSASDEVVFIARADSSYCSFTSKNSIFSGELLHDFTDWVSEMLSDFISGWRSS